MATFNIYQHPYDDSVEKVKRGFSFAATLMNIVLLGWVWAFDHRAPRLAWRLLMTTIITYISFIFFMSEIVVALWVLFSFGLGGFANKQVEYSLKRRDYTLLETGVNAATQ
jgi:hypothetical protein